MSVRKVNKTFGAKVLREGAGVLLHRAFGLAEAPQFDPFLMLDDFSSNNPSDYKAGFPWHPHRGIETVTYIIEGEVNHEDSLGNKGTIVGGAVQWMTAGSGIIHQEMPNPNVAPIKGFQLWINLPKKHKMIKPRYQDILPTQIKSVIYNGAIVKVIAGSWHGIFGPVSDLMVKSLYLDVSLIKGKNFIWELPENDTAFLYVISGTASIDSQHSIIKSGSASLLTRGDTLKIYASNGPVRFLLISGRPIGESVAWNGPIVMNNQEELETAFQELESGNFIKK